MPKKDKFDHNTTIAHKLTMIVSTKTVGTTYDNLFLKD